MRKGAAKAAVEMVFNSGKEAEVFCGAEVPRSLHQAEAAEVTKDEEERLHLECVWVTACRKSCH